MQPTIGLVPGVRRPALQADLACGQKLIPPRRGPRRRDPQLPRHGLKILAAQQTPHRLALAPGRKPSPTAVPGSISGRPPGSLRRRRTLIWLPHFDTPPASTLSQSSVQGNPGAQDFDVDGRVVEIQSAGRDIAKRKQAEQTLRESEELHRVTLSSISDAVFITDDDGRFTYICPNVDVIFGFTRPEVSEIDGISALLGSSVADPERLRLSGEITNIERDIEDKYGEVHSLLINMKSVSIQGGTVLFSCRDVTLRKRTQEALDASEERYHLLVDNIPSVVWRSTEAGETSFISDNVEDVYGYSPEDIYKGGAALWFDRIHPEDRDRVKQELGLLFSEGRSFDVEYRIKRKDSQWIWLQDKAAIHKEVDGVAHAYGVFSDITAHKQADEALRRHQRMLAKAQELARFGSFEWDVAGNTVTWSDELHRIYGRDKETFDVTLETFVECLHPDDRARVQQVIENALRTGDSYQMDERIIRPDGENRILATCGEVVRDDEGRPITIFGSCQDVTENRKAECALEETLAELRTALEAEEKALEDLKRVRARHTEFVSSSFLGLWWFELRRPMSTELPIEEQIDWLFAHSYMVECNDALARMYGFRGKEEMIGKGLDWWWGEDRDVSRAVLQAYIESGYRLQDSETVEQLASGEIRHFWNWATGEMKDGHLVRIRGYGIDVTARKQAERELRDALAEVARLKEQLQADNVYLLEELKVSQHHTDIVGQSRVLQKVLLQVEQVASTDATVLILGETGTGKELIAHAVHSQSPRANRPLVRVNCAALPATLIESELFGNERGAFTGASEQRIGRFELADGGTVFLDEIGDLPIESQAKLLRVLQEGEFERLGPRPTRPMSA